MSGLAGGLLVVLGLVVLAFMAGLAWALVGWIGAWRLNRHAPRFEDSMFSPFEMSVDAEDAEFTTRDGVTLRGWLLHRPETRRTVVAMHGYRGNKTQLLGISSNLWRMGFNVLLFDFRGRGASDSAPFTMGLWEVEDLAAALDWLSGRVANASVGLLGFSMGAVVALLGGADPRVRAIVADSAFANQRAMLEHAADRDAQRWLRGRIGGRRFMPVMEWWHRRWGKPSFDAIAPEHAVDRLAGTPLLFIHGAADRWIPMSEAERLFAAAPQPKEAWYVRGAAHCGAYFADRMAYSARVAAFFDRNLARRPSAREADLVARGER
jgi:dipeptidyl aminopeptidase/acylaminoacyl peptidase